MKFEQTSVPGVIVVTPDIHRDGRGFFLETYHREKYVNGGIAPVFVQDNHSKSAKGTLRGLHIQLEHTQAKLVHVIQGEIWDVAVDVRLGSPSFGKHFGTTLTAETQRQLFIPLGFAHGFAVLSEEAEVEYKCSDIYDPGSDISIAWNDPDLAIPWPIEQPALSEKDESAAPLSEWIDRLPGWRG